VLSFSRDGKRLAAGKDFGRVVLWDVASRKFVRSIDTGQGVGTAVALSSDGALLATAGRGDNFRLKLWRVSDGKLIQTYDFFGGYLHSVAFSPDGAWMVAADNAGTTHVLDVPSGKQIAELKEMYAAAISPVGDVLMTVSKEKFTIWSTKDWTKQRVMPRTPTYAIPLDLNPKSDTFVVTAAGTFRILRLSTGELLPTLPRTELPKFNGAAGGFAAFRPDTPLLFGHSDDRLWAWNTQTGETCVSGLMYSESGVLSPDGALLAGAKDNSIMAQTRSGEGVWLWDTNNLTAKCFGQRHDTTFR
jgi:WD40 repeat protein